MGIGYSGIVYYCDSANPGSTSDSTNLMMSSVPKQMEEWLAQGLPFPEAMIGGDSIFQSHLPWLCTPYSVAEAAADPLKRNFNKKFCGARDAVERYIGVMKERFPVLDCKRYGLRFDDVCNSMKLVQVCVAIHNFILKNQTPVERRLDQEEYLQNLADVRFPPHIRIPEDAPLVPDGSIATHDYLLNKYTDYFRRPRP